MNKLLRMIPLSTLIFLKIFLLYFFILSCSTEPAKPEYIVQGDYSYAIEYLDWLIEENMSRHKIPACTVALIDAEKILYKAAYGHIDIKKTRPVSLETFFRVGSISKVVTALAVMKLVEQGCLNLDNYITEYIPEFSIKSRFFGDNTITIRHLLSHKSGIIRDYYAGIMGQARQSHDELIGILKNEYLCYKPGVAFKYSNIGYTLLAIIIERVTGRSFQEYVQEEILIPLGMVQSSFVLTKEIESNLAKGTMRKSLVLLPSGGTEASVEAPFLELRDKAAGGLFSNVLELSLLIQYLIQDKEEYPHKIITNRTFNRMLEIQFPEAEQCSLQYFDYGLGFMKNVIRYKDLEIYQHNGSVNGFFSMLLFSPQKKIGMVILTNSEQGLFAVYDIASRAFKNFIEAKQGNMQTSILQQEQKPVTLSQEQIDNFTGRYATIGVYVDITARKPNLYVKPSAADIEIILIPVAADIFKPVVRIFLFEIEVAPQAGFEKAFVKFKNKGENVFLEGIWGDASTCLVLERVVKVKIPTVYDTYLGVYEVEKDEKSREVLELYLPTMEYELVRDRGWLKLKSCNLDVEVSLLLKPVNEHEAVILGSGETVFFNNNSLSFSGFKAKKK